MHIEATDANNAAIGSATEGPNGWTVRVISRTLNLPDQLRLVPSKEDAVAMLRVAGATKFI